MTIAHFQFFIQLYSYKTQSENVERQAAEATNREIVPLPWLRTQAHLKTNQDDGRIYLETIFDL